MTKKERFVAWCILRLPLNRHIFYHLRIEWRAFWVRILHHLVPRLKRQIKHLHQQRDLLVNIGCGPKGLSGWINIDLFACSGVTLVTDCRKSLPFAKASCQGIHVEHFLEHLNPPDELIPFLQECRRSLQVDGILRIVVPDAQACINAYLDPNINAEKMFVDVFRLGKSAQGISCKMDVLNHIFHREHQHYAGYDAESVTIALQAAGFTRINQCQWNTGNFPGGPIDLKKHRLYSLYIEAQP